MLGVLGALSLCMLGALGALSMRVCTGTSVDAAPADSGSGSGPYSSWIRGRLGWGSLRVCTGTKCGWGILCFDVLHAAMCLAMRPMQAA